MNCVFKTKWSAAHQQYVVTDEHHATKGKAAKSAVAIAVAAFMMAAGAQAAYKDPNPNISSASVAEAQRAFETAEYQKDWGLAPMLSASPARTSLLVSWTPVRFFRIIPILRATASTQLR